MLSARLAGGGTSLVLLAVVYAAIAQGAYYPGPLRLVTLLVLAALATTLLGAGASALDVDAPIIAATALAGWYVVAALVAHHASGAFPAVELLCAAAAAVCVVRHADEAEQRLLLAGLLATAVVVALLGWEGVAWRQVPRALHDGALWRAASTITYANATAGLVAALAVLALGWVAERRSEQLLLTSASYALVVGLLATASRAGMIAFAAGLAWLVLVTRGRVVARTWPVLLGASIAAAALLPSMVASHQTRPLLALGGLVVGAAVALVPARAAAAIAVVACVAVLVTPSMRASVYGALRQVRHDRSTVSSPDRGRELHAALQVAHDHPISGAGPGRVDLTWNVESPSPATMHVAYAHNEYLQTLDEVGVPGLAILAAGIAAVALAIRKARRRRRMPATVGAVAALVTLAVHSSFDFLWHVPVIPLTAAVVVGTLLPASSTTPTIGRSHQ